MKLFRKLLTSSICICVMASALPAYALGQAPYESGQTIPGTVESSIAICQELGYVGQDPGSDVVYFNIKTATRLEALRGILVMRGLRTEVEAFEGKENFADAAQLSSQTDRSMLAYAHANPQLGFSGYADGSFGVADNMSSQMFFKVLATNLGYIQGQDFTWDGVCTFARNVGLGTLSDKPELTNGDFCVGLLEALRAPVKGGTRTLADKLVADNVLPQDKAVKAGLVPAPEPISGYIPGAMSQCDAPTMEISGYENNELTIIFANNDIETATLATPCFFTYSIGGKPYTPNSSSDYVRVSANNNAEKVVIKDVPPDSIVTIKAYIHR